MSPIAPGTPAPEFRLITEKGKDFTQDDLRGQTTVFVFYPFAFSPVCTDQLNVYNEVLEEFAGRGARLGGAVSLIIPSRSSLADAQRAGAPWAIAAAPSCSFSSGGSSAGEVAS